MNIIHRYTFFRVGKFTLLFFLIALAIVVTTQLLNHTTKLVEAQANIASIGFFFLLLVPTVTVAVLPLAFVFASVRTIDEMDNNSERIALAVSGSHPLSSTLSHGIFAAALALLILLTSMFLEPRANRALREGLSDLQASRSFIAASPHLKEIQNGLFTKVGSSGSDGRLHEILIYDRRDARNERLYVAKSGYLTEGSEGLIFVLFDGSIQTMNRQSIENVNLRFDRYVLDSSIFEQSKAKARYGPRQTDSSTLFDRYLSQTITPKEFRELVRRSTDWLFPLFYFLIIVWAFRTIYPLGIVKLSRSILVFGAVALFKVSAILLLSNVT